MTFVYNNICPRTRKYKKRTTGKLKNTTPWEKRCGEPFKGTSFAFGQGVHYKPNATAPTTKERRVKTLPPVSYGVFLGYQFRPGFMWTSRYYVADLDKFVGRVITKDTCYVEFGQYFKPTTVLFECGHCGFLCVESCFC